MMNKIVEAGIIGAIDINCYVTSYYKIQRLETVHCLSHTISGNEAFGSELAECF